MTRKNSITGAGLVARIGSGAGGRAVFGIVSVPVFIEDAYQNAGPQKRRWPPGG